MLSTFTSWGDRSLCWTAWKLQSIYWTKEAQTTVIGRPSSSLNCSSRLFVLYCWSHFACFRMGWERTLTFTGYGKIFQRHRRMLQRHLNMKTSETYRPIQTREARVLVQNLILDDEKRDDCLRRYVLLDAYNFIRRLYLVICSFSTAIIMRVAYGHQISSSDADPYLHITQGASHALSNAGSPGGTPIDFFPFRKT